MKRMKWLIYLTLYLTLALSIAFLPGSCDRAQGETKAGVIAAGTVYSPATVSFSSNGKTYEAAIIADLDEYIRKHGDKSKLLRFIDHDARTVMYVLLNETGDMFTGMQVITSNDLNVHAPLMKRLWRGPLAKWN